MPAQAGVYRMSKIQYGAELQVSPGTSAAATQKWRGMGAAPDDQTSIVMLDEIIGYISPTLRPLAVKTLAGMALTACPMTYEQFPFFPVFGFGGSPTGTADGVGTDFIYTVNLPTSTLPYVGTGGAARTLTIEGGDNLEARKMVYALPNKFGIAGKSGGEMQMSGMLLGQSAAASTFTAAITAPTQVRGIPFQLGKLYLDAVGGTYGTTQLTNVWKEVKFDWNILWVPQWTGDGSLSFSFPLFTKWNASGTLKFLHAGPTNLATGLQADYDAGTIKLLQMKWAGVAFGTGGTTYTNYTAIINIPVVQDKPPSVITDNGGVSEITLSYVTGYDYTAANAGSFIVANQQTALI